MKALELGIYDDLDIQTQPLLNVDILSSNVIVFGGHLSGKTNFLKSMIVRMHQNFEPGDSEEIYIIDFGGNLGDYAKLPLVAACFDNSNEENVRRIFKTLESRYESNSKALGSSRFMEVYEESTGDKPRHVTFIIDNVTSFFADERYMPYQEELKKYCRDGLSRGISVVVTASDTSGGVSRYMSMFNRKFAFDVPVEVYLEVFGVKMDSPMKNPGRGMTMINGSSREFQAFLPFENEKAELNDFSNSCAAIGHGTVKLKDFADELNQHNFSIYSADGSSLEDTEENADIITVGLDYYEHMPVRIDLHEMHSIAIYGKKKFGKTNLLRIILNKIRLLHPDYRVVLLDDGRRQLAGFHIEGIENSVYIDKIEKLTEYLDENGYFAKVGNRTFQEMENPVTVFVLQSKMLYQSVGKNLLNAFARMTANAEEKGYYFIYSDIRKVGNSDREAESLLNNSLSAAFLLDNIAEFASDKGSRSVFGEMDPKELKAEYAKCELGDGYFYDIESDELKKLKFLKTENEV